MAFKRSAVRSRLSPPSKALKTLRFQCFFVFPNCFKNERVNKWVNRYVDLPPAPAAERRFIMATIQEKIKEGKIVSYKFKACLRRDEGGKQVFKCMTWYPPENLTKAMEMLCINLRPPLLKTINVSNCTSSPAFLLIRITQTKRKQVCDDRRPEEIMLI